MWEALHYITLGYPEHSPSPATRRAARDMLLSLQSLLPCGLCRDHLRENLLTRMPLTDAVLETRRSFGEYIVALRDYVKRHHVLEDGRGWPTHNFDEDVVERLYLRKKGEKDRQNRRRMWVMVFVAACLCALATTYTTTKRT